MVTCVQFSRILPIFPTTSRLLHKRAVDRLYHENNLYPCSPSYISGSKHPLRWNGNVWMTATDTPHKDTPVNSSVMSEWITTAAYVASSIAIKTGVNNIETISNTFRYGQNCRDFGGYMFKCICWVICFSFIDFTGVWVEMTKVVIIATVYSEWHRHLKTTDPASLIV